MGGAPAPVWPLLRGQVTSVVPRATSRSRSVVDICTPWTASTPDLNVFAELATMRALAPTVSAGALLDSATRQGARALGFDADYGTIEPGKSARLLAIDIPPDTDDVEEYLVSGVEPSQLRWLEP